MHGDGDGLYLCVSKGGTKSWILRVTVKGEQRRREIGLGSLKENSLAQARKKAGALRAEAKDGRNPIAHRDRELLTFESATRQYHASIGPRFRSHKHSKQLIASFEKHAFKQIGDKRIGSVCRKDVLAVLKPIWITNHPTAKRLRQRFRRRLHLTDPCHDAGDVYEG